MLQAEAVDAEGLMLLEAIADPRREAIAASDVAVVVAHPDDATIGCGAQLARLHGRIVVLVTDGAPRNGEDARRSGFATPQTYAAARRNELLAALRHAAVPVDAVRTLNIPDQEAALRLVDVARSLLDCFSRCRIRVVLTHAYEGGHPDHDATAFAVHLARHLLREAGEPAPALVEFASYHDPDGSRQMAVQSFLPADSPEILVDLDEPAQDLKRRLVASHASQQQVLQAFPTDRERYRVAPAYDFLAAPHPWRPFYETLFTTMTRERWQGLAAEALAALGLSERRFRC
jgi:N-acetylglucosamine malate deacetylase 2